MKSTMKIKFTLGCMLGLLTLALLGCGVERQYEDYKFVTTDDKTLSQQNHPHGFKQTQCFYCHVKENIHQIDRINDPLFPLAKDLVESQGLSSCSICHGDNGN